MLKSVKSESFVNYILAVVITGEKSLDTTDFIWPPMGMIWLGMSWIKGQVRKKVAPYFPFCVITWRIRPLAAHPLPVRPEARRDDMLRIDAKWFFFLDYETTYRRLITIHPVLRLTSYFALTYIVKWILTHWGRGHLNCLNARSRGLNNLNELLYCVSLNIYNKFANYFCELKVSGNTHQRP